MSDREQSDTSFLAHDATVRGEALRVLQKRRVLRRVRTGLGTVAVALLCGFILRDGWIGRQEESQKQQVVQTQVNDPGETRVSAEEVVERSTEKKAGVLTDEQLVALFPAGSCFIAEVNGQKKLVFVDPEVQRQFFN